MCECVRRTDHRSGCNDRTGLKKRTERWGVIKWLRDSGGCAAPIARRSNFRLSGQNHIDTLKLKRVCRGVDDDNFQDRHVSTAVEVKIDDRIVGGPHHAELISHDPIGQPSKNSADQRDGGRKAQQSVDHLNNVHGRQFSHGLLPLSQAAVTP